MAIDTIWDKPLRNSCRCPWKWCNLRFRNQRELQREKTAALDDGARLDIHKRLIYKKETAYTPTILHWTIS